MARQEVIGMIDQCHGVIAALLHEEKGRDRYTWLVRSQSGERKATGGT
jgi:hypothetical protein